MEGIGLSAKGLSFKKNVRFEVSGLWAQGQNSLAWDIVFSVYGLTAWPSRARDEVLGFAGWGLGVAANSV